MEIIHKYFKNLSEKQVTQFEKLASQYAAWNEKINLISRKDIENIYERHVLHSLAIAKFIQFKDGTKIIDIGTGGGFPAIPLAILFPKVEILAVDSMEKKIRVVDAIKTAIELNNLQTKVIRAEKIQEKFDFVVSRAVAPLTDLIHWSRFLFHPIQFNHIDNGIIALKGGDLSAEIKETNRKIQVESISQYFDEDFFETKSIVYVKKK